MVKRESGLRKRRVSYEHEISACSIFGAMNTSGERFTGEGVIRAIANMHVRSNGLGGGFAIYGLYPEYKEYYALHIMVEGRNEESKKETDAFLNTNFDVVYDEEIPHAEQKQYSASIENPPLVWRYFAAPDKKGGDKIFSDDDYVVQKVMEINTKIKDAYVFSSGKNMGVFKGVGYPEDIAEYYLLDQLYKGYIWTAHGRFPTNTQGWWGGAHPFSMLDWTVVHNGEISSYGTNRRYLEMYGYHCTLQTDSEVMTYAVDLLMRRQQLPVSVVAKILAPPVWKSIEEKKDEKEKKLLRTLRMVYAPLLMNGPFTVIIAHHGVMIGLTDRIRLRPLTAGVKGEMLYLSSEEAAIRLASPQELDKVWTPDGGEPIIGQIE
ncbi:MAG: glutamine amidotransferase family protein [Methanophagales archaeon]|nr:glutamine amidotransferase family protein [Methanophagales archaeon]